MSTSILIVEDEAIVAMDLVQRLSGLGYSVAGTVDTAEDAISKAIELQPGLVLMDIALHGDGDGIDAAKKIRGKLDVPIVYLSAHADVATLERAKMTEPGGYVVKPYNERELHAAIELALHRHEKERRLRKVADTVVEALNYIDDPVFMADERGNLTFMNGPAREMLEKTGTALDRASVLKMLSSRPANGNHLPKGMDMLSRREQEVLGWFLRGFGTATIGTRLHVSPQTVRNHLKNVCRKLDVRSQVELRELFADEV
jgi:DNA-binding NarL/FixJ family response regulator